ncbi:metallophosphoesterase [Oryzomonas sagensis]|uniref:Metallophosphoesterase n=1 Tax=Oryzomonas sagensis TaxID=2603857 RepID=A0ABQ6TLY7_9BACT|nr:metallophosphoesterase [Oryzomonas sagensis]KAB0669036.1 metallophosphoesterase [Oryzomonas sagensis]
MISTVNFAVAGDTHGHMHLMVERLKQMSEQTGVTPSFVLQVGDFQPIRNQDDLTSMNAPERHRSIGDFPDFAAGSATFPWPLWFIAGNHEPFYYLDQHLEGFTLVPNCHYLGRAGRATVEGLVVAGLSGIYSEKHFHEKRTPTRLKDQNWKRRGYFSDEDLQTMLNMPRPDILLLHDCPVDVFGRDVPLRGNLIVRELVERMAPKLVLCGHIHQFARGIINGSQVYAFGHIKDDAGSVAIFQWREDAGIELISVNREQQWQL